MLLLVLFLSFSFLAFSFFLGCHTPISLLPLERTEILPYFWFGNCLTLRRSLALTYD